MEIIKLHQKVHRILKAAGSDPNWKLVYDLVFEAYSASPVRFEWYDPDTDYEEDVMAFVKGLDEYVGSFDLSVLEDDDDDRLAL